MPLRAAVLDHRTIGGQKTLGMPGRLELLYPPLALAGELMGVFGPIVEITVLPMFHTG